jgi:hypothetical protein
VLKFNKRVIATIDGKDVEIEKGVHVNHYGRAVSIRIPSLDDKVVSALTYEVVPEKSDRTFFTISIAALVGLSLATALTSNQGITPDSNLISKTLFNYRETIFGGIITAALAAIGFLKNSATNRTRFWFILPIIISASGILVQRK